MTLTHGCAKSRQGCGAGNPPNQSPSGLFSFLKEANVEFNPDPGADYAQGAFYLAPKIKFHRLYQPSVNIPSS
jgi:hypothetical protein